MIDLSFKYGLVKQRGAQKVKQIRGCMSGKEEDRVAALEEWMRAIKAKHTSGRKISCKSCTHPTHEPGQCPGKKVFFFFFFFSCGQTRHFKVSPVCSTHRRKQAKIYQVELREHMQLLRTKTVKQTTIKLESYRTSERRCLALSRSL